MTIRTARIFGDTYETDVDSVILVELDDNIEIEMPYSDDRVPFVLVHGATESEVLAAFAALDRSREECEWHQCPCEEPEYASWNHNGVICTDIPDFCPSCGKKVVVSG